MLAREIAEHFGMPADVAETFGSVQIADPDQSVITILRAINLLEPDGLLTLLPLACSFDAAKGIAEQMSLAVPLPFFAAVVNDARRDAIGQYHLLHESHYSMGVQMYEQECGPTCNQYDEEKCQHSSAEVFSMVEEYRHEAGEDFDALSILDYLDDLERYGTDY